MQGSSSRSTQQRRSEKQASSCTECRRRKQKCSQGHPCTNCARRFPQPICDYGPLTKGKRTGSRGSGGIAEKAVSRDGGYPHLNLAGVQDAILQLETSKAPGDLQGVLKDKDEFSPIEPDPSGAEPGLDAPYVVANDFSGHLRNWFPFRLAAQNAPHNTDRQSLLGALRAILERENGDSTKLTPEEDWMIDAAHLIWAAQGSQQPTTSLQSMDRELRNLPMVPTKLNKELVRTHLRLLSRFKANISGIPNPDNPFMKHWVPYLIQDPLLMNVVLFTSACFLNETGHLPKTVVTALRGLVFKSLNDNLRSSSTQTGDAAILGVAEMLLNEWYWGRTQDLHAHMKGLRTMIMMRGGLQDLGMHGYISKMVLIHDICMALAHETQPDIYGLEGFAFNDPIMVPFQASLNSPLISGWPTFASCANSLHLHPCTAMILDDVRTMMEAIIALPPDSSAEQLQYVSSVASWVYGRIGELPENVPLYQTQRPRGSVAVAPSDTSSSPSSSDASRSPKDSSPHKSPGNAATQRNISSASRSQGSSPTPTEVVDRGSPPADVPDPVYRMVRMAATIYCRAVLSRAPTSLVCNPAEVGQIWGLTWRIPLASRSAILGIYLWTLLAVAPSVHSMAPARFIKTFFVNGFLTAAVENWHVTVDAVDAALRLQRWLKGSASSKGLVYGGESSVEKHGFAAREALKNIANVHKGDRPDEDEDEDEKLSS